MWCCRPAVPPEALAFEQSKNICPKQKTKFCVLKFIYLLKISVSFFCAMRFVSQNGANRIANRGRFVPRPKIKNLVAPGLHQAPRQPWGPPKVRCEPCLTLSGTFAYENLFTTVRKLFHVDPKSFRLASKIVLVLAQFHFGVGPISFRQWPQNILRTRRAGPPRWGCGIHI